MRDRDNRKSTATAFMFFISFHRVYFSSIVRKSGAFHDQREIKKRNVSFLCLSRLFASLGNERKFRDFSEYSELVPFGSFTYTLPDFRIENA